MSKKILIINPFGVGDVLFSTPLISLLGKKYPGCYIAYICNIRTREILETNPDIRAAFVFERDEYRALWKRSKGRAIKKFFNFWKEINRRKFDIAIDLSLGKEYAFFSWLVGIRERRGFDYKGRGRFLTHRVGFHGFDDKPISEYYLDIIGSHGEPFKLGTVLVPTDSDKARIDSFLRENGVKKEDLLVGIAPGGGVSFGKKNQDKRRWPAEKFSRLADRIIKDFNAKIVLIWGPDEEELVKNIANLMDKKAMMAPRTSIREMAALCKRCGIVVCSEGGPLHIASSQEVKTVSIFGPVDEKVYGPYPPGEKNLVITSNAECRPCYKRFKLPECGTRKCLEDISVDSVFDRVAKNFTP